MGRIRERHRLLTATEYIVIGFDDTPTVAQDELCGDLVLVGTRNAARHRSCAATTATAATHYHKLAITSSSLMAATKASHAASCVDVQVDIVPFGDVDEAFAWDEGEDDRSLAVWRVNGHIRYFSRQAAARRLRFR